MVYHLFRFEDEILERNCYPNFQKGVHYTIYRRKREFRTSDIQFLSLLVRVIGSTIRKLKSDKLKMKMKHEML